MLASPQPLHDDLLVGGHGGDHHACMDSRVTKSLGIFPKHGQDRNNSYLLSSGSFEKCYLITKIPLLLHFLPNSIILLDNIPKNNFTIR